MKNAILFITIFFSFLFCVLAQTQKFDFADEPEDSTANAYSSLVITGSFSIYMGCRPAVWVQQKFILLSRTLTYLIGKSQTNGYNYYIN
ncbi:MAG: hypothetical protein RAP70_01870 [Candidatus Celaenobacter antarcticus]|nr:hypothetical protein [Candidatus Celaenobacter antarcticus]MDP8313802.1 hypothetical protein [Candidatus Celaenobacter antarcticus]